MPNALASAAGITKLLGAPTDQGRLASPPLSTALPALAPSSDLIWL